MARHQQSFVVEVDELIESAALMHTLRRAGEQLPAFLRAEIEALATGPASDLFAVEVLPNGASVQLTPRFRALIGNLRAQQ